MSRALDVLHHLQELGSDLLWHHAYHCPHTVNAPRPQVCAERPIMDCPVCGGIGLLYEPAVTVRGIFRRPSPHVAHHKLGQLIETDGSILIKPLPKPVFQEIPGKVQIADVFIRFGVQYAVMNPPKPPEIGNEQLAWRFDVKRQPIPVNVEDFAAGSEPPAVEDPDPEDAGA